MREEPLNPPEYFGPGLGTLSRDNLFDLTQGAFLVLAAPALLASSARILESGFRRVMAVHLAIYGVMLVAYAVRRRLAYGVRAGSFCSLVLIAGIAGLVTYGLAGAGLLLIGTAVTFATILLNRRAGFGFLVVGGAMTAAVGWAVGRGLLVFDVDFNRYSTQWTSWLTAIIGLCLVATIVLALGRVHQHLRNNVVTLEAQSRDLDRANVLLREEIHARGVAEASLLHEKEKVSTILRSIGDGVIATDAQGRVEYLNPVAETLTGWSLEEAQLRPVGEILMQFDCHTGGAALTPIELCLKENRTVILPGPTALISRDGRRYQIRDTAAPIRSSQGDLEGAVLVFQDATEHYTALKEAQHQAAHDPLTGLLNRHEFERRLANALVGASSHGAVHALVYFDIDHFKIVNDTAGHLAGDELLRQVAFMLSLRLRGRDSLARMGGDEFALLLEHCPPDKGYEIAKSMLKGLRELEFSWEDRPFEVGASLGVTVIDQGSADITQILREADTACYEAKRLGRGQVAIYRSKERVAEGDDGEQRLAEALKAALEGQGFNLDGHGFALFLQPIFAVEEGATWSKPVAQEVLLRLHFEGEILAPDQFLPLARRLDLMESVDRWVVRTVLRSLVSDEPSHRYSINLSAQVLNDRGFPAFLERQLELSDLSPSQICFELTERAVTEDREQSILFSQALKKLGCGLALDRFGSDGQSSLKILRRLPLDYVKIDVGWVATANGLSKNRDRVRGICELGKSLQVGTIAESVESDGIGAELARLGLDYAQGYGLGRPAPVAAYAA